MHSSATIDASDTLAALKAQLERVEIDKTELVATAEQLACERDTAASERDKYRELYVKTLELYGLAKRAASRTQALMCGCGNWEYCHRAVIAEYLEHRGVEVQHILADGVSLERHRYLGELFGKRG